MSDAESRSKACGAAVVRFAQKVADRYTLMAPVIIGLLTNLLELWKLYKANHRGTQPQLWKAMVQKHASKAVLPTHVVRRTSACFGTSGTNLATAVITIARCANETQERVLDHLRGCAFCAAHPERIVHMARIMAQNEYRDSVPCGMSRSERDANAGGKQSKAAALKQWEKDVLTPKMEEVKHQYEAWKTEHREEPEAPADCDVDPTMPVSQSFSAGDVIKILISKMKILMLGDEAMTVGEVATLHKTDGMFHLTSSLHDHPRADLVNTEEDCGDTFVMQGGWRLNKWGGALKGHGFAVCRFHRRALHSCHQSRCRDGFFLRLSSHESHGVGLGRRTQGALLRRQRVS